MAFRTACLVVLSALAFGLPAGPAAARKRDPADTTGLRAIRFNRVPPDFAYDDGAGPGRLSGFAGKVVVLNFWATWCEPCRAELDAFADLRRTYGAAVPLITVSSEAPGVARAFLEARHLDVPVVEDPQRKIFDAYSVTPIPVTIVLGCDGTVRHVSVGELDWNELRAAVAAAAAPAGAASVPASAAPTPAAMCR